MIRVPLIDPVSLVIYRLDIPATYASDPPGDLTEGNDYLLREPVISRTGGTGGGARVVEREEMTAVTIPCQHEVQAYERLNQAFPGNDSVTQEVFVLHRQDLASLSLLSATTGKCSLKPGDRIDRIEKQGRTVLSVDRPLFVYEVRPASWGFGPDGYDLELLYTSYRDRTP